jgi:hypothetical protein
MKLELCSAGGVRCALHPDCLVSSFVTETAHTYNGTTGVRLRAPYLVVESGLFQCLVVCSLVEV